MEIVLSKNFALYVADYYFFSVLELNGSCAILVTGWKCNAKLVTNHHFFFVSNLQNNKIENIGQECFTTLTNLANL